MPDRKEQILDVAEELLQTRSFSAFSYQDVSDRIGISKATIHHHYPSKDDLSLALVTRYRTSLISTLEKITQEYTTPWKQLEAYTLLVSQVMQSGHKICLTGSLQSEYEIIANETKQELANLCAFVHTWLTRLLADGKKQQMMTFPGPPEDQASLIQAALQGALQQARAHGPKQFTTVVRQIKAMLKTS
ncbi:MAG: TetR family transcriptional regulator [Nitrospirales bacterium]|nr:MAG: TetR family transcriptional regulator [Nitrospirales bacterium]